MGDNVDAGYIDERVENSGGTHASIYRNEIARLLSLSGNLASKLLVPKGKYPKVVKRVGKSPPQYVDEDEED